MLKIAHFNRWFESKSSVLRAQDAAGSEPVFFPHDSKVPREHLRARALRGSDSWLAASSSAWPNLEGRGGGSEGGKVEELVKVWGIYEGRQLGRTEAISGEDLSV